MRYKSMTWTILDAGIRKWLTQAKNLFGGATYCWHILQQKGIIISFFGAGAWTEYGNHQQQGKVYWEDIFRTTKTMNSMM